MNSDFAKSILDNPYNRVEDDQKIELFNVCLNTDISTKTDS